MREHNVYTYTLWVVTAVTKIYKLRCLRNDTCAIRGHGPLLADALCEAVHGCIAAHHPRCCFFVRGGAVSVRAAWQAQARDAQSSHVGDMLGDMPVALETLQLRSSSTVTTWISLSLTNLVH